MADLWRDFWIRETGTGQRVAQLHDRYMMMTEIHRKIIEKYSKINFCENPSSGSRFLPRERRTNKHNKANKCFSKFCERAQKKKLCPDLSQLQLVLNFTSHS
jgi:hypothetical protein